MLKPGIATAKMLILRSCREAKRVKRRQLSTYSSASGYGDDHEEPRKSMDEGKSDGASCWVPHPRTGIYVPKGHEWVMDDVPETAASFSNTYWLRSVDGVERPDPDVPSHHYFSTNF